jgi:hypothetical protein
MKHPLVVLLLLGFSVPSSLGEPPPVGAISADVGFSVGVGFSGGSYQSLQQRHLSDFPDRVLALIFSTPW